MNSDQLARMIAASIARHQTRGLVDGTTGMDDVVIHGRVDLLAVADDMLAAWTRQSKPARSWAPWFVSDVEDRRRVRRQHRLRKKLAEQFESGLTTVDAAIARLRIRNLDGQR